MEMKIAQATENKNRKLNREASAAIDRFVQAIADGEHAKERERTWLRPSFDAFVVNDWETTLSLGYWSDDGAFEGVNVRRYNGEYFYRFVQTLLRTDFEPTEENVTS